MRVPRDREGQIRAQSRPGATDLLRERGVPRLAPIVNCFPMTRIEERLGFRPQYNFEQWLEEPRSRPEEQAPQASPWW